MSKAENVLEYYRIYEMMSEAVPDDANMLAVIRAAEFMIASCIAQAKVDPLTKEQTYARVAEDVKNFAAAFEKHHIYEENIEAAQG